MADSDPMPKFVSSTQLGFKAFFESTLLPYFRTRKLNTADQSALVTRVLKESNNPDYSKHWSHIQAKHAEKSFDEQVDILAAREPEISLAAQKANTSTVLDGKKADNTAQPSNHKQAELECSISRTIKVSGVVSTSVHTEVSKPVASNADKDAALAAAAAFVDEM